jgi:hypothetical protein
MAQREVLGCQIDQMLARRRWSCAMLIEDRCSLDRQLRQLAWYA